MLPDESERVGVRVWLSPFFLVDKQKDEPSPPLTPSLTSSLDGSQYVVHLLFPS